LREAVQRDAPILIDQEGGRVQRMGAPHYSEWTPPLEMMDRATDPARAMYLRAALIGSELRAVGIDVNCTPTADIAGDRTHPFLHNRCYGRTVDEVAARARANAEGCLAGGVLPVVKHMPGHGRGSVDSHLGLPVVDAELATLETTDFEVFRRLAGLPLGMSAHVVYSALDTLPGTISPVVIEMLRRSIGFEGLLMTDDISMQALPGDTAARSAAALAAGCDLVLHCNGEMADMEAAVAACPRLDGTALRRAEAALARRPAPATLDIEAARAELRALTA
jgi:beta-N-acetylhexosaminidase